MEVREDKFLRLILKDNGGNRYYAVCYFVDPDLGVKVFFEKEGAFA